MAPASASRTGVGRLRLPAPMSQTKAAAEAAPTMASQTYWIGAVRPRWAIPTSTARAAPELMPRIPGSARGLRVSACMRAPESARAAPDTRPRTVRGTRERMTSATKGSADGCPRAGHRSWSGMDRAPTITEAAHRQASRTVTTSRIHPLRDVTPSPSWPLRQVARRAVPPDRGWTRHWQTSMPRAESCPRERPLLPCAQR